jgi:hypothetical protein
MSAYHSLMQQHPGDVGCQPAASCLMAATEQLRLLGPPVHAGHFAQQQQHDLLEQQQHHEQPLQPPATAEQYDAALAHHFASCSFNGEACPVLSDHADMPSTCFNLTRLRA